VAPPGRPTQGVKTNIDSDEYLNTLNRNGTTREELDQKETPMSFVGSYEESLFLGRLSTSPSKPITFVCDIGVLATGKSRPSLKCPTHLILNFSAYYYQLPDEDQPTPYVATIQITLPDSPGRTNGYRIPLKGQLQIVFIFNKVIKNPECTAMKVFFIPYNLIDMPLDTKTFIRQKSYAKSKHNGNKSLRYAIHVNLMKNEKGLRICSFIRVVFSSRPLGSYEDLVVVTEYPQPSKYMSVRRGSFDDAVK
jgi:hypothetical protein